MRRSRPASHSDQANDVASLHFLTNLYERSRQVAITGSQTVAVIQDELRGQYSIGYVSSEPVRIPSFRRIQLAVARPGLTVQTRSKYWATN